MKYLWEPKDIKQGVKYNVSGSEIWAIGYTYLNGGPKLYVSVSMHDFNVCCYQSAEEFAARLTEEGAKPVT
jgi:hypothetical protein